MFLEIFFVVPPNPENHMVLMTVRVEHYSIQSYPYNVQCPFYMK